MTVTTPPGTPTGATSRTTAAPGKRPTARPPTTCPAQAHARGLSAAASPLQGLVRRAHARCTPGPAQADAPISGCAPARRPQAGVNMSCCTPARAGRMNQSGTRCVLLRPCGGTRHVVLFARPPTGNEAATSAARVWRRPIVSVRRAWRQSSTERWTGRSASVGGGQRRWGGGACPSESAQMHNDDRPSVAEGPTSSSKSISRRLRWKSPEIDRIQVRPKIAPRLVDADAALAKDERTLANIA